MRRETPQVNAGSMADIAFLLLIFWLVATSIKPERGILEEIQNADDEVKIAVPTKASDLVRVYVNEDGMYLVDGEVLTLEALENDLIRLIQTSGKKAKLVITAHYDAPYEEYVTLLRVGEQFNLNIIEDEIKEETVETIE